MRLFELESTTSKIVKQIKSNCGPYLSKKPVNRHLHRGMKAHVAYFKTFPLFQEYPYPQNRQPKDVDLNVHEKLVSVFSQLGFKANRNNSIFCNAGDAMEPFTTDHKQYGENYERAIIFPVGEFSFTWSPSVHDLFTELSWEIGGDALANINPSDLAEFIGLRYTERDFTKAINSDSEIAITGNSYYALKVLSRDPREQTWLISEGKTLRLRPEFEQLL